MSVPVSNASSAGLILKAACSLSVVAISAKVLGFTEKLVVAQFFGTSEQADVYFAATALILSVVFLAKELLNPSFLPVFVKVLQEEDNQQATAFFRKTFVIVGWVALVSAGLLMIYPESITKTLLPGFSETKQAALTSLIRWLAPAMALMSVAMLTTTALNARRRFLKAAIPDMALKLLLVVGLIALAPRMGIHALPVALGIGACVALSLQLLWLPEGRKLLSPLSSDIRVDLRPMLWLMSPVVLGVVFSHISGLIDNLLASRLPDGHLSYLGYAKKLTDAVLLIGPVALVTVFYSHATHLSQEQTLSTMCSITRKMIRLTLFIALPVACIMIGLRSPIVATLFQRGQFSTESTEGTALALWVYAAGLVTFSLETLLVHSFFSLSDTKTPIRLGIICVVIDVLLAIVMVGPFGYVGIAAALVFSKTLKIAWLALHLHRKLPGLFHWGFATYLAKLSLATGLSWPVLIVLRDNLSANSWIGSAFLDVMLPALATLAVYTLIAILLGIEELKILISLLLKKYRPLGGLLQKNLPTPKCGGVSDVA